MFCNRSTKSKSEREKGSGPCLQFMMGSVTNCPYKNATA